MPEIIEVTIIVLLVIAAIVVFVKWNSEELLELPACEDNENEDRLNQELVDSE